MDKSFIIWVLFNYLRTLFAKLLQVLVKDSNRTTCTSTGVHLGKSPKGQKHVGRHLGGGGGGGIVSSIQF